VRNDGMRWNDFTSKCLNCGLHLNAGQIMRSNSALLTDTYTSPLRAQRGAAKRGR